MKIYNKSKTLARIRNRIKGSHIPMNKIAYCLDITYQALARKLNGSREFTLQEVITISNILECDLYELLAFDILELEGGE